MTVRKEAQIRIVFLSIVKECLWQLEAGTGKKKIIFLKFSEGVWPYQHLDLGLLGSITVRASS